MPVLVDLLEAGGSEGVWLLLAAVTGADLEAWMALLDELATEAAAPPLAITVGPDSDV